MRQPTCRLLLILMIACWQALLLVVCVPTASAHRAGEPSAHPCCTPAKPSVPKADVACPHCSDGHGRFVDAAAVPVMLAPTTRVDRLASEPVEAEPIATLADERPLFRPPDVSLLALRCALIR